LEEYLNSSTLISIFVGRYNVGFDHKGRSLLYDETHEFKQQHMVKNFCDLVGVNAAFQLVPLKFEKVELAIGSVGLFPGHAESCPERGWHEEKWIELYHVLKNKGHNPFFIFGPNDKKIKGDFVCAEPNTLKELAGILKGCQWLVSNDTGPMHLSAAMGTKTIGLFGPNTPKLWNPYGEYGLYFPVDCSPCINNSEGDMGGCVSNLCMQNIEVEDVLKIINNE